jgi:uncharacterized Zn finger protein
MTNEVKRPTATLNWSLYVDCPQCDKSNDLAGPEHDTEHHVARHIFSNAWDKLNGHEVECEHCGHEFTIEKVEY